MSIFEFKTIGNRTFAVYNIAAGECVDTMGLFDIAPNKREGFAAAVYSPDEKVIEYNITGRATLKDFLSERVTKKQLLTAIDNILNALLLAKGKKVNINNIIFESEYIFIDPLSAEVELLCLPVVAERPPVDLIMFFKNLLMDLRYEQSNDSDYVIKLLNYLNDVKELDYGEFKEVIYIIDREARVNFETEPVDLDMVQDDVITFETNDDLFEDSAPVPKRANGASPMFRQSKRKRLTAEDIING